jgi:uncharacterized delta-60 repeat protein
MSKVRLLGVAAAVLALVFATGLSAAAGDLDTTFDGDGIVLTDLAGGSNDAANSVAVQTDGKVVVAGEVVAGSDESFAVVRYTRSGGLDPTFDGDGKVRMDFTSSSSEYATSVAIQADGKIVVVGAVGIPGSQTHADFSYPPGAASDFAVARYLGGPPPCKVPNVRGKKLAAAKARIKRAGCRVGKVTRKPSKKAKKGHVLSQSPRAGANGSERRQGEARRGQGPQALNSSA